MSKDMNTTKSFKRNSLVEGKPKEEVVRSLFDKRGVTYEEGDHDRVMLVRASDGEVDSDGDIVNPEGWENFEKFFQNPVFLKNHSSWIDPVGVVLQAAVVPRKDPGFYDHQKSELQALVYFDRSTSGEDTFLKFQKGVMRAVSVRFRPLEFRDITEQQRLDYKMGSWGRYSKRQELIELSAVSLPSNRNAVVLEKSDQDAILKYLSDLQNEMTTLKSQVNLLSSIDQKIDELKKYLTLKSAQEEGIKRHSAALAELVQLAKRQ